MSRDIGHEVDLVLAEIKREVVAALTKHPKGFNSAHEGYAVILEELDELWDEVRADNAYGPAGMKEAIQVAAMGVRFIIDLHHRAPPQFRGMFGLPS